MQLSEPIYRQGPILAAGIPLGGLGTGSVELRADGRFHDWEIFNNYQWSGAPGDEPPDLWSEDAFFALRVRAEDRSPQVRLLYQDDQRSHAVSGWYDYAKIYNYPFLYNIAGLTYSGQYPFACIRYEDDSLPVELELEAFTPFIPYNAKDSALPMAFFVFNVRNRSNWPCEVSLLGSFRNCVGYDLDQLTLRHQVVDGSGVMMSAEDMDPARRTAGSMMIRALGDGVSVLPAWTDGRGLTGFPNAAAPGLSQLFYSFRDTGNLTRDTDDWRRAIAKRASTLRRGDLHQDRQAGWRWRGAACRQTQLAPDEQTEMVFVLSWFFPNHYHYDNPTCRLGHMYENWFTDAAAVSRYAAENFARLRRESRQFCDALYQGLDPWLAASLNAQLTTFPQAFWWTKDGEFTAWEGMACCMTIPNAHTVWSSFQPLLFFPELYTAMKRRAAAFSREETHPPFLEAEHLRRCAIDQSAQADLGGWYKARWEQLGYRPEDFASTSSGRKRGTFLLLGSAVELLRDYQWTGDRALLEEVWPLVRESIQQQMEADRNGDGLPDGAIAYLTYDHWFPPATNCYSGTMWLAELRAAAHLARLLNDTALANQCESVLRTGAATFERLFWNGKYYSFCHDERLKRRDDGCLADQVSGHLYLRLCGLASVHDPDRVRSALQAVARYNAVPEHGLLNGADPRGRSDWRYFARYSARGDDEALSGQWVTPWTGTEYYVAATMIAEGLVDEGLAVARAVYDRHVAAGMLYNHMECGEHYFRALAAWALLPALQGLEFDAVAGRLRLAPRVPDSLLLLPGAYGRLTQQRTAVEQTTQVTITAGQLTLRELVVAIPRGVTVQSVSTPQWRVADGQVVASFSVPLALSAGQRLTLRVAW